MPKENLKGTCPQFEFVDRTVLDREHLSLFMERARAGVDRAVFAFLCVSMCVCVQERMF